MFWRVLWAVILCGTSACVDSSKGGPRPPELIVLDSATEINEATRNGILELNYRLESAYPAEHVTASINAVFKGDRWRPLTDDWLNPGNPSGYVRGWSSFLDGSKTPNTIAHVWSAEWKNEDNDLVIYSLRFDSAIPPGELFLAPGQSHSEGNCCLRTHNGGQCAPETNGHRSTIAIGNMRPD